ncbi:endonuclease domain-containing protein [Sphingomonas sp. SUN019]|uniref:endonuclease domain-containing protein n=1 Tax=Sphingomonas sp. SUN019 TaxID=2937788 RepID=UPI0021647B8C|nr:endonuclease domain-containing protein [Sphingomonas sp. SUN019]UVO49200.1 endonuclease domain-containing protein [Sphingomonas sp. SUN019]
MRLEATPNSRRNAKRLRQEMTPPEIALWLALRSNEPGLRFRKQYPAGEYVLDFYCAPARLAIEVDGEAHERGDRLARDVKRDQWLTSRDVRVVRYPAKQVLTNLEGVLRHIITIAAARRDAIEAHRPPPPPSPLAPPPPGGGG